MPYGLIAPGSILAGRPWWTIELWFGGSPLRLAGAELDIADAASGTDLHFVAAFDDLDVSDEMARVGEDGGQKEITADLMLPVDVASLISQGHLLDGARAVVSRWVEGDDWSMRRVVIDGTVQTPQYGEAGEPVSVTIAQTLWSDPVVIPLASEAVTGDTWASATSLVEVWLGVSYPVVIGTPGVVATDIQSAGRISGTKAVWADFRDVFHSPLWSELALVIAGHHVETSRVVISSAEYTAGVRVKVFNTFDALNQPVATVLWYASVSGTTEVYDYDGAGTYQYRITDTDSAYTRSLGDASVHGSLITDAQPQIFVSWLDDIDHAGSQMYRGKALRDAGDVLHWALEQTGAPVDHGRCIAQAPLLARFKIDAVIETPVDPWVWIRDALLPVLPVSIESSGEGYYFQVWRWDATAADAVDHLDGDVDPDIEFVSPIKSESGDLRNDITLRYGWCARVGDQVISARMSGDPYDASQPRYYPSALCRASMDRRVAAGAGARVAEVVSTDVIDDDATAVAVLSWMVAKKAMPEERVTLRLTPQRAANRLPGAVVTLTRAALGLSECVAIISRVAPGQLDVVEVECILRRWPGFDRWGTG